MVVVKGGDFFKEELDWPWRFDSKEEREREREGGTILKLDEID